MEVYHTHCFTPGNAMDTDSHHNTGGMSDQKTTELGTKLMKAVNTGWQRNVVVGYLPDRYVTVNCKTFPSKAWFFS